MTAKQWLNRGFKLDQEIDRLEEAKTKMRNRLTSAVPNYSQSSGTSTSDPHKFDAYANYCLEIDKRIDELYDIKCEIQAVIFRVSDTKLRTLLIARYINFKTFEQIAYEMGYSIQHIFRFHDKAVSEIEKILKYESKCDRML